MKAYSARNIYFILAVFIAFFYPWLMAQAALVKEGLGMDWFFNFFAIPYPFVETLWLLALFLNYRKHRLSSFISKLVLPFIYAYSIVIIFFSTHILMDAYDKNGSPLIFWVSPLGIAHVYVKLVREVFF